MNIDWENPHYKIEIIDFGEIISFNKGYILKSKNLDSLKDDFSDCSNQNLEFVLSKINKIIDNFIGIIPYSDLISEKNYVNYGFKLIASNYNSNGVIVTSHGEIKLTSNEDYKIYQLIVEDVRSLIYTIPPNNLNSANFKEINNLFKYLNMLSEKEIDLDPNEISKYFHNSKISAIHIYSIEQSNKSSLSILKDLESKVKKQKSLLYSISDSLKKI